MNTSFSPDAYLALLGALSAGGYRYVSYDAVEPEAQHLLLRHDIDFALEAAVAMAEAEHALGVRATYFVLVDTEFYNPCSSGARACSTRV